MGTSEPSNSVLLGLCQQLKLYEDKLRTIERSKCITQRWNKASTHYREVKALVTSEKRTRVLLKIEQAARERWFLLTLKAKYAGNVQILHSYTYVYFIMYHICGLNFCGTKFP